MGREVPRLAHGQELQSGNSIDTATKRPEEMLISIVESGIEQVPPEFIRPPHERVSRLDSDSQGPHEQIPVIDLSMMDDEGAGKRQVLAEIVRACEDWGCFHLINHGVPALVMDAAMKATKGFFALPAAEREKYRMTKIGGKGYGQAYGGQTKDWNDRLFLTDFSGEEEPKSERGAFFDLVLTNPPGAQEALETYGEAVYKLVQRTMVLVSEALGQSPEFLSTEIPLRFGTITNHYPPCPQPDLVLGLLPHEDGGIFTFLHQDEVLGLEVLKDERWVPVPPVEHALIFMVADLLQIVGNDRFKSVTHRVLAGPIARTVMANFAVTGNDAVIQPAPELCSDLEPPAFRSVVYKDYLKMLLRDDIHAKRLEAFRLGL
ncbi:hypothetical protein M758_1G072500 [Ceratodon purpureus]|nr:hypothetical protein M758_1G072500 [Ceratodon purpureus]